MLSTFIQNISQEKHAPDLKELYRRSRQQNLEYFQKLLQAEQQKGRIRKDIPTDLMAYLITQVAQGLTEFLHLSQPEDSGEISQEETRQKIKQLVWLLKSGLQS